MRSTSRWKHVRISHGGSGAGRPVDCVLSRPCGPMNSASAVSRFSLGQGTGIPPFPQKIDVCGRSALRHFRLQYSYTTLLCISLFFLKNAEKKVLKSSANFLTRVWQRFSAHFLRILGADMHASSRMFMHFLRKGMGDTHRKAGSDADAGIHRQRAMQKFYPRRALPPRAPPRRKYLETIYHLRCKEKASPYGDAVCEPRRALPPRAPPAARIS